MQDFWTINSTWILCSTIKPAPWKKIPNYTLVIAMEHPPVWWYLTGRMGDEDFHGLWKLSGRVYSWDVDCILGILEYHPKITGIHSIQIQKNYKCTYTWYIYIFIDWYNMNICIHRKRQIIPGQVLHTYISKSCNLYINKYIYIHSTGLRVSLPHIQTFHRISPHLLFHLRIPRNIIHIKAHYFEVCLHIWRTNPKENPTKFTSWWLNQPVFSNLLVKLDHFPK